MLQPKTAICISITLTAFKPIAKEAIKVVFAAPNQMETNGSINWGQF